MSSPSRSPERVSDCSPEDLDGLLAQLESAAVAEADGHPRDDIALLAVRPDGDARAAG